MCTDGSVPVFGARASTPTISVGVTFGSFYIFILKTIALYMY